MKNRTLLALLALLASPLLLHAAPDYKFGKVSKEELEMSSYEPDPEARAVILNEDTYLWYDISTGIDLIYEYTVRIKVLRPEGTDVADVELDYTSTPSMKESISGLNAAAYNLVDGKVVKTPLKKQYIFDEQVSDNLHVVKFSIPEVREGTVIEYRYRLTSDYVTSIPSLVFQHDIPVMHCSAKAAIPEFFRFNRSLKGYLSINISESLSSASIPDTGGMPYTYTIRNIVCTGENLPALRREPYVWCLNDYRSMLEFELSQIAFPMQPVQSYSTSWADVNDALRKTSFDSHCRMGNPFRKEVDEIVARQLTNDEKLVAILRLIQSKITWDGSYTLFSEQPRAAANKGTGSSSDINFALMAALRDAGFTVTPILLNPRSFGRLPYTHATISRINSFVVKVDYDGKSVVVDGTDDCSYPNLLPTQLLTDRARIYGINGDSGWCDLTQLTASSTITNMVLRIDPEQGVVTGSITDTANGQKAFELSRSWADEQSEEEFIRKLAAENDLEISNFKIEGQRSPRVTMQYDMTRRIDGTDDMLYLNATIIPFMSTNSLNTENRKLPVEFSYPETYNIRCSLEVPEGYTVEELPRNIAMSSCENRIRCRYIAQTTGRLIQFNFSYTLARIVYPATEFPDLNTFMGMVTELSNSQIVLKKI